MTNVRFSSWELCWCYNYGHMSRAFPLGEKESTRPWNSFRFAYLSTLLYDILVRSFVREPWNSGIPIREKTMLSTFQSDPIFVQCCRTAFKTLSVKYKTTLKACLVYKSNKYDFLKTYGSHKAQANTRFLICLNSDSLNY